MDTFGTGKVAESKLEQAVSEIFDLTPDGIINMLDLRRPQYRKVSAYGHFGRENLNVAWEKTDKIQALLAAVK